MQVCLGSCLSTDMDVLTNKQGEKEYTNTFYRDIRLDQLVYTNTPKGVIHRIMSELHTDSIEIEEPYGIPYLNFKKQQDTLSQDDIKEKIASYIKKRLEENIDTILKDSVNITFPENNDNNNFLKIKIEYAFINEDNLVQYETYGS